ncbi:MAG: hypothetical protein IJX62_01420 [Clostridia bacterium]|nr:hypothetical protein [Clostridia bacterium]
MFRHTIQNLIIVFLGCLTLFFLVATIFSMLPTQSFGLQVTEKITASSARIRANEEYYSTELSGNIKNTSDDTVTVDAVSVLVSNGEQQQKIELEGFTLPPRTVYPLWEQMESDYGFDRVISVRATVNGEEVELKNAVNSGPVSGMTLLLLLLCAASALLTAHACKIRYYMKQEAIAASQQ